MNPLYIAVAIGLVAAYALFGSSLGLGAGPFFVQGTTRFWDKAQIPFLKQKLGSIRVAPHPSAERVWVIAPGGSETALQRVQAIQMKGDVAVSSVNLDSPPKGVLIADMTPTEFGTIDTGLDGKPDAIAVLPILVGV